MKLRILPILMVAVLGLTSSYTALSAPSIDDFLREPDLPDMALSPDGTHLAMIINSGDEQEIVVKNLEDPGFPIIGRLSERGYRRLNWANNERILISTPFYYWPVRMIAVDKEMDNRTLLWDGPPLLVTNFLRNKVDHILLVTKERSGLLVQYEKNIVTGKSERVATGSSHTFRFLNNDDGKPLYRFDYLKRSRAIAIYEYQGDSDWHRIDKVYLNRDDEDAIDTRILIALSQDNLVYRKRDEETGFYGLVLVDRETRESRTLVSLADQDVQGLLYGDRTHQIVGYYVESDNVRHVYFDQERQSLYDEIASQVAEQIGEYNFYVSGLSRAGRKALIRTWGADNPYSFHLWDFETGQLTFLADASTTLGTESLSLPAITTYRARDGQSIRAYLLLPRDFDRARSYPTVILPHGGPHMRSRPVYDLFAQFISTRGYIVVQPNFRGSVGYGRDFEVAGYRQWGGTMQDDLTDAVNFMITEGYTDPEKVCIVGHSYGGYAALMGVIKTPSLFKCAISLNGVTHLAKQVRYAMKDIIDKKDWDEVLFKRIGYPGGDKKMLDRHSPALNADKISVPVMIVAGTEDDVVPYSQAKLMEKALGKAGADYEFIELKNAGHYIFVYRENTVLVLSAVEEFLQRHLGPPATD